MRRVREWWPVAAAVLTAFAVLAGFWLVDPGAGRELRPLGVGLGGWACALVLLVAGLAVQLAAEARTSLQRERRLVASAAALRMTSAEFEQQAATDMLTGLATRRAFNERLGAEFRRARRYRRPLSVLMIDLDRFKEVNDRHGHIMGDLVLAEVARVVRAGVRESDLVARYGGEELVAVLPETGSEAARALAERLRGLVGDHDFEMGPDGTQLTVSIGVAVLTAEGPSEGPASDVREEADLVRLADQALYRAKAAGRDRVELASDLAPATPAE